MGRKAILGPGNAKGKAAFRKATRQPRSKKSVALIKSVVGSVLDRTLETKYATDQRLNVAFNSAIGAYNLDAYPALPPVNVATGFMQTYNRAGNEITPTSLKVHMTVGLNSVQRSSALRVDVYVLTRKDQKVLAPNGILNRVDIPQLFNAGFGGGLTSYTGLPTIPVLRMNLNEFTLISHRKFTLAGNVGLPNGDTTAGNSPNLLPGCVKYLDINVPCPKTLKYDEGTATTAVYPNNFAPFIVIGYCKVDGTAPDVAFQSVVASWTTALMFKDA